MFFDSGHTDTITDVCPNFSGRLLATCGDDKTVRISDVQDSSVTPIAVLEGHEATVLRVAWAHSRFPGSLLLSGGLDGQIILWKDMQGHGRQWSRAYSKQLGAPIHAVAWGPHEYGLTFACALANGKVHIFTSSEGNWEMQSIDAHSSGCNGVSWCPCMAPGSLITLSAQQPAQSNAMPYPRIVTCGNEPCARIWKYQPADKLWQKEQDLEFLEAQSVVKDVQWAPNVGVPFAYIAAGYEEGRVVIWLQDGLDGVWRNCVLPSFESSVCRLAWSMIGTFLSVSCADGQVTLWNEDRKTGQWALASTLCAPRE